MMPLVRVDRGAIRFVLKGANIMTPGLTSPGGALPQHLQKDQIVAIIAEGKEHICAIGRSLQSADEITVGVVVEVVNPAGGKRSTNQGIAIENIHYLNDGLWKLTSRPL
ncbi:Malignant T-cell-amplified sequence 1 [Perkinsus olseni]|nr:Malignant T-cell-amplified sequence 1 [Perkinsus olseni]